MSLQHTSSDIEAPFGSMTYIPFGSRWPRKGHHSASEPSWMVTISNSDGTFGYHITGWMVTVSNSDGTFGYHITEWMVTVSNSDDTFGYHITGGWSLSHTVMIPSGIILPGIVHCLAQ